VLIVTRDHATQQEVDRVVALLKEAGAGARLSRRQVKPIIGAIGDREKTCSLELEGLAGVGQAIGALKPYKLVPRDFQPAAVPHAGDVLGPDGRTAAVGLARRPHCRNGGARCSDASRS
jgi:3-deoxy-7-phosphoheptulonate synthase